MSRSVESFRLATSVVMSCVRLVRTLRAAKRSAELTEPEISALTAIVYSNRIVARDLAGLEGVTPATISRLVAEMEAKGLVRRSRDRGDARLHWIAATPLGKRRVRDGHLARVAPLERVIDNLPRAERETLAAAARILEAVIAKLQIDE